MADLLGQVVLGEWLGEKRRAGFQQPALKDLGGKAGHVEDWFARPALLYMAPELTPAHTRHLDVGQHQMDCSSMLLDGRDRFAPVTRLQCLVAGPCQHAAGEVADRLLIVDHENRVASGWPLAGRRAAPRGVLLRHEPKYRSFAGSGKFC
jgi:hypothetical protein